jgi:hypothetical protein
LAYRTTKVFLKGNREAMIDLHFAPTPNGWKVSIMLEELGLPL